MKYTHTNRHGFLLGTIDFFTSGVFFIFYMRHGLQQELDEILGRKTQRYYIAYLIGIPTLFIYPLIWMGQIADELRIIAVDMGIPGPYTSFRHMVCWNTIGLPLFGPSVATMRFFDTLNKIERELNSQESGLEAPEHDNDGI